MRVPSLRGAKPFCSLGVNSAESVSLCDGMRSRLKLWNESGTKRARIGDSPRDPIRSPQHLALTPSGGTRSSLQGLHKRRSQGGILKNREGTESNQKWSRVNMIHAGCTDIRRERDSAPSSSLRTQGPITTGANWSALAATPSPSIRTAAAYGSLRSQGRRQSATADRNLNSSSPPSAARRSSRTTSPPASQVQMASGWSCGMEPGRGFPRSARTRSRSGARWRDI
jgi:hypothetical protein